MRLDLLNVGCRGALTALTLFIVLSAAAVAPPTEASDYWFALRGDDVPGTGSRQDPFNGATAERFDSAIASIPEGSRIRLGPGTFVTRGVRLKNRWQLHGAGKERTTIKLADGVLVVEETISCVLANFDWEGFFDRIEISDLTIDCNREKQPAFAQGKRGQLVALTTATRQGRIRRVRALGTWANPGEGFPFSVVSTGSIDGSNRIEIDACENLDSVGNLTAISAFDQSGTRISGFIRNCLVTNNPDAAGFGSGGWKNFAVTRNTARNMGAGIVIDTHHYDDVRIERNRFYGTRRWGVVYNGKGPYRNIVVRKNYIAMDKGAEWALLTSEARVSTRIEENTFVSDSAVAPLLWIGAGTSGQLSRNILDATVSSDLTKAAGLVVRQNRDLRGKPARLRLRRK